MLTNVHAPVWCVSSAMHGVGLFRRLRSLESCAALLQCCKLSCFCNDPSLQ